MFEQDCEHIKNLIPLYIDSMLTEEEMSVVEKHLDECKNCKEDYLFLKSVITTASEIPEIEVPKDFHKNVMNSILHQSKKAKRIKLQALKRTVVSFAAAAAVIALSVAAHVNFNDNSTVQNVDDFVINTPVSEKTAEVSEPEKQRKNETKAVSEPTAEPSKAPANSSEKNENSEPVTENEPDAGMVEDMPNVMSLEEDTPSSKTTAFRMINISVNEEEVHKALEILEECEKDEIGYMPEGNTVVIIEKLSNLNGFTISAQMSTDIQCDHITINE